MNTSKDLESRYSKLFSDGKLISLHVSKWSMSTRLIKEDIGVTTELPNKLFRLGNKMLIKDEVFTKFLNIEQKARSFIKNNSRDFPIAQAHFVPNQKIVSVVSKLQEYKLEYEALVGEFVTNYESHKTDMLMTYPDYYEVLEPNYPDVAIVKNKFSFDIDIFEISVPKKLKSVNLEELQAKDAAMAAMTKQFEAEMEVQYSKGVQQIEKFLFDTVYSMREEIIRVFELVAEKIKNREVITKTNLTSLRGIIDNFKSMDFLNDNIISSKLAEVALLVNSDADFKENKNDITRLSAAVNGILDSARNVTDINEVTGQYFRRISI